MKDRIYKWINPTKIMDHEFVSADQCKEMLLEFDSNWNESDAGFRAALILIFGTLNAKCTLIEICQHITYPMQEIKDIVRTIKAERMWRPNTDPDTKHITKWKAYVSDWNHESEGGINFCIDVARAQGYITKA